MKRVLILTVVIVAIFSICGIAQYYAAPPTIDNEQAKAYKQIITFAAKHKYWENFSLDDAGGLHISGKISLTGDVNTALPTTDILDYKTNEEIRSSVRLLNQTSTMMVYRVDDLLLFKLEPRFPLMKTPGYVYSTDGTDPNQQNTHLVNIAKPFYTLGNGWYSSKEMNTGAR